jgi:hypothetical protein
MVIVSTIKHGATYVYRSAEGHELLLTWSSHQVSSNTHEDGFSYSARLEHLHQSVGRENQLSVFKVPSHLTVL